jgi:hypothetical protein
MLSLAGRQLAAMGAALPTAVRPLFFPNIISSWAHEGAECDLHSSVVAVVIEEGYARFDRWSSCRLRTASLFNLRVPRLGLQLTEKFVGASSWTWVSA